MNKFIHRENLALFRKRLDDPRLSDAQRQAILRLLNEEHVKGHQTISSTADHGASILMRAGGPSIVALKQHRQGSQ